MRAPAGGAAGAPAPGPILLVDDEPFMLRWLAWHLTRVGSVSYTHLTLPTKA